MSLSYRPSGQQPWSSPILVRAWKVRTVESCVKRIWLRYWMSDLEYPLNSEPAILDLFDTIVDVLKEGK